MDQQLKGKYGVCVAVLEEMPVGHFQQRRRFKIACSCLTDTVLEFDTLFVEHYWCDCNGFVDCVWRFLNLFTAPPQSIYL